MTNKSMFKLSFIAIRQWWSIGLKHVSNSSRHSLGPEIDPRLGHGIIMDPLPCTCVICGSNGLNWSLPSLFTSYALQKGLRRLWLMHCWLHGHVCEHAYYGFILDKAHKTNLDASPKSYPALEIISRAAPSVEAHHRSVGPDAGRNSGRRRIIKNFIAVILYSMTYF